ncbi:MAG: outer membrane protein assembly factor BamA [Deltaproteobacteria bacterium]|nr:outer membrane protein assembly factor BamA [Deltaproteobacteria bacterium]
MSAECIWRRAGLALSALLALAAAPGWAQDSEWLGRRIVAIGFECTAPIDRRGLAALLPMRVGDELRRADLEEAGWRLEQTGLFKASAIEPVAREDGVALTLRLERHIVVNVVRFRGNHALGGDELERLVRLRPGAIYSEELRDQAVARLRQRYAAEGFELAQVSAGVTAGAAGEVDVTFRIEEGEPLRVAAIEFAGELPVPPRRLQRAIGIRVEGRYVRSRQVAAEKAIVRLLRAERYFEARVDSTWELGANRRGTLRFQLDPGPRFDLTWSGNLRFSASQLLELMDLPGRVIVTDGSWRELARRVERAYREAGYYVVRVGLSIAPGPPKTVHFDIVEGRRFRVAEVGFEGAQGVSPAQLRAVMATQPPSWLPWRRGVLLDDVLADDLKRLWYLYRRYGFEAAEIVDLRTRFEPERGRVFITVVIEEGPRTRVQTVELAGFEPLRLAPPELALRVGEPLDREALEADRQRLVTALARAGFPHAEVAAEVSTSAAGGELAASVRFTAAPGTAESVGAIIIQNNLDTKAGVIARALPFKSGDPLDPEALLLAQSQLYRLGLFRSVTVRPLPRQAAGGRRDIGISVAEKPPGSLQWGAGYNTRDGIRGFGEISHSNLQGLARRLSLRGEFNFEPASLSPDEYLGDLAFREPRLADTQWALRSDLIAQRATRTVDRFSVERFAFIPALERPLLPELRAGFDLQVEQSQVFDVASDVLAFNPRDQGRLRSISLGPFLVYDGRDDAFMPSRGVFDSLRLRYAPAELGADVAFVKLLGQHTHYVPITESVTFLYVLRGGWAYAFADGDQVPIRERFFLGGRTTVRGFGENVIGPAGSAGSPLGGDLVGILNTELRFPLAFGIGGAVFADGGGVYLQDRATSLDDFRRSCGLGLRYNTPVGPLSLDYGFKLDRRTDESVGELHFSIGAMF